MYTHEIIDAMPIIPIPEGMSKERFQEIMHLCLLREEVFLCNRLHSLSRLSVISTNELELILKCISESICNKDTLGKYIQNTYDPFNQLDSFEEGSDVRNIWVNKNIVHYS